MDIIYNIDCLEGLKKLPDNSVDLTVTSPPYDNLRTYHKGDEFVWNLDIFKPIADELYRVTKPGHIVVWIVGDACINGSETGTSFKQALYFMNLGFKLHDTMIYEKNSSSFPAKPTSKRYSQIFEYMFVFVKGKIRDDIKLIADKYNKWAGWTNWGTHTQYDKNGNLNKTKNNKPTPEYSLRNNIWRYSVSFNDKTNHPAVFPERLAEDCILSWSVKGDLVLDPFMGSGTTAKMALLNGRHYLGFETNEDYYNESLKRIGKYYGKSNDSVSKIVLNTPEYADDEAKVKISDTTELQLTNFDTDKELDAKTELWNNLIDELNDYFNTQKVEILKNLKLTFSSKSNDDRVKQLFGDNGKQPEMPKTETTAEIPSETVVSPIDLNKLIEQLKPYIKNCVNEYLIQNETDIEEHPVEVEPVENVEQPEEKSTRKRKIKVGCKVLIKSSNQIGVVSEYNELLDEYYVDTDDLRIPCKREDIKRCNNKNL